MKTSDIIRIILNESGQTQDELARVFGVSRQTISSWLRGDSEPQLRKRQDIELYYLEIIGSDTVADDVLADVVAQADQAELSVQELMASSALLDRMLVLMTYHTNSIEGSTMTMVDNQKVLLEDKVLTNRTAREQQEARNHRTALFWLLDQIADGTLTWNEQLALDVHIRMMNGLVSDAGQYRQHGVRILGSHVAVANHVKIPTLMTELFAGKMPETFAEVAQFHASFEKIHPFSDGNGRVGRLLIYALMLIRGTVPPIIERERRAAYYHALEQAQMHGNVSPLTYLIAREVIEAKENLGI